MRLRASILAVISGILIIQPLFANFGFREAYGNCAKAETSVNCLTQKTTCPTKKKCSKPKREEKKKDCRSEGCNPFLGCTQGNFYVHQYTSIALVDLLIPRQKSIVVNDNRVLKQLNECWHPPEII